jgi:hypothetical protein
MAMQVQYKKAEIFRVGKRYLTNLKMLDNWVNGKTALLRPCLAYKF